MITKNRMYRISDNKVKDALDKNGEYYEEKASEYFGIQPATDEKTLQQGIDTILEGYGSRDMAVRQAERYMSETMDIATSWLSKKNIHTLDEFKKWCSQRQSYLRKGRGLERRKAKEEAIVNDILAQAMKQYREYWGEEDTISDSQIKDGLLSWLFGDGDDNKKKKKKRRSFEDLDEGDKIIFKRASGSKDYGVVQSVFKNLSDKGIEYGVKVKGSKDNIVVPEEKITEVEDSANKRMYRKRMTR